MLLFKILGIDAVNRELLFIRGLRAITDTVLCKHLRGKSKIYFLATLWDLGTSIYCFVSALECHGCGGGRIYLNTCLTKLTISARKIKRAFDNAQRCSNLKR